MSDALKVWIGTEPAQRVAQLVLEFSLKRHSSQPLEIKTLEALDLGCENQFFTGFSIYRFHVPKAMGYLGRAVVMDVDIVNMHDIAHLFALPMTSAAMARRHGPMKFATSVMLLDCEKLKHWDVNAWAPVLSKNKMRYHATMWGRKGGYSTPDLTELDPSWNQLDQAPEGVKQIHYTNLGRQPWKVQGHNCAWIFLKELKLAIEAGAITKEFVLEEEAKGHVYVGLLKDAMAA